jgi:hypothetical protein
MQHNCQVYLCRHKTSHVTAGHLCGQCKNYGHGQAECGRQDKVNNLKQYKSEVMLQDNWCTMKDCGFRWSHCNMSHNCRICHKNHNITDCSRYKPKEPEPNNEIECPICCKKSKVFTKPKIHFGLSETCKVCTSNTINIVLPCGHICLCDECYIEMLINKQDQPNLNPMHDNLKDKAINILAQHEGKIYCIVTAGMGCSMYYNRDHVNSIFKSFFMHSDDWGQYGPDSDKTPELNEFLNGYIEIKE